MGMRTAAVPVLDRNADMMPDTAITAAIIWRSVLANFVTMPPILWAMPVSNRAPPTTNIAMNMITFVLTNPEKTSPASRILNRNRTNGTATAIAATGILFHRNRIIATTRTISVMAICDVMNVHSSS